MKSGFTLKTLTAAGAVTFLAIAISLVNAQPPRRRGRGGRAGRRRRGGGIAPTVFTVWPDKDGFSGARRTKAPG